ncbi:prolyl-tRNA synthetase [Penicillium daleae]|uniref:proline--tRNA ligase n=1 Tax=Penicillium daleae TaxID=63821 RepID=A0AAD6FYN8_9EURO|nr:prolyl-tRNA synthetase [Penicillium daleae]KAJ5433665.1 prolyl-tRNA synthetase [Penicillium daleae]
MEATHEVICGLDAPCHAFSAKQSSAAPTWTPKNGRQKKKTSGASLSGVDVAKEVDFPSWYQQVLLKGEMIDYYDISGCYILRPGSWEIWEILHEWFNREIRKMGVRNCSFPLFVTEDMLNKEQNHIDGFSAEVAWVTQSGSSKLDKKIAIRPTSETIIYPYLASWIKSWRELPLRLNQWNSVVRWEFKNPQPFLRSREFYWQEGHTSHLSCQGADQEVLQILDLYSCLYHDFLAIPVVPGRKTEKEKFAGADYTTTVEAYIPATGRAIQGATSHGLGQNFSKMFNITVEAPCEGQSEERTKKTFLWQNSWAYSTRVLGVMVMVHGDDKGLVIPPRVAPAQVILVPVGITASTTEDVKQSLVEAMADTRETLQDADIRVESDLREEYSPGWKFNHWELKGVPLRLEIGPKELQTGCASYARRDNGDKGSISFASLAAQVAEQLASIQSDMYTRALEKFRDNLKIITNWADFTPAINCKHLCLVPFCLKEDCEDKIKKMSEGTLDPGSEHDARAPSMGAKSLCIPFQQPSDLKGTNTACLREGCERMAEKWCMFGRSY